MLPCERRPNVWTSERPTDIQYAVAHCLICPNFVPCREGAMDRNVAGVVGGLTAIEREAVTLTFAAERVMHRRESVAQMYADGISVLGIAAAHHVSKSTIQYDLRRLGLPTSRRKPHGPERGPHRCNRPECHEQNLAYKRDQQRGAKLRAA